MVITHVVKAPNTRLLSGEWNANHIDSKAYRDTISFTAVGGSINFGVPLPLDIGNVRTSVLIGFVPCRSGSITGASISATVLGGDVGSVLRTSVSVGIVIPAFNVDIPATGNRKGSATQAEGILNFNANDIIWVRFFNITSPVLPITFNNAIVHVELTYD